jgi:acyl-CoA reductase-like NAD-dependent aldehyde dehydrogenase
VIVVGDVADDFGERLVARLPEVVVGDPRDPATRVAALITPAARERVLDWVAAAVSAGARVLAGGHVFGDHPSGDAVAPP